MRFLIKTLKDENLKKVPKTAPQYVTIRTAPQTLNKAFLRDLNIPSASNWNHLDEGVFFRLLSPHRDKGATFEVNAFPFLRKWILPVKTQMKVQETHLLENKSSTY